MLRVVAPVAAVSAAVPVAARRLIRHAVAPVYIRIAIEIIVVIDGDVVITAPAASIAPASTPGRSHRETHPK